MFKVLFVFVVLAHARRRIVHFNITEHPTAQWTAQQISEAFPWEAAPRYLLRDRDRVYGPAFRTRMECMGIEEVLTAPRSPWQNPFAERAIGSVRSNGSLSFMHHNEAKARVTQFFRRHAPIAKSE